MTMCRSAFTCQSEFPTNPLSLVSDDLSSHLCSTTTTDTMKALSHGLNIQKKTGPGAKFAPAARRPALFDDDEDDNTAAPTTAPPSATRAIDTFDLDAPPQTSTTSSTTTKPTTSTPPPPAPRPRTTDLPVDLSTKRVQQQRASQAESIDASIFDYDAAYDALHAGDAAKAASDRAAARERRPKYMEALLASAEVRKRDQLRAKDRLLAREREAEGDEFADKDKFVTGAYKAQQEEVRRLEAAEAAREEEEARRRRGKGMQGFYRGVMQLEEERHRENVEAAARLAREGGSAEGATADIALDAEVEEERRAADEARRRNKLGDNIIINDDGQVADKRQLLGAGLNLVPKPKTGSVDTPQSASHSIRPLAASAQHARSVAQQASRERQSRHVVEQLAQAQKRAADAEVAERERLEKAARSSKSAGDIAGARERFLQRKREEAAARAAGEGS